MSDARQDPSGSGPCESWKNQLIKQAAEAFRGCGWQASKPPRGWASAVWKGRRGRHKRGNQARSLSRRHGQAPLRFISTLPTRTPKPTPSLQHTIDYYSKHWRGISNCCAQVPN